MKDVLQTISDGTIPPEILRDLSTPVECVTCGERVHGLLWTEHARRHNPSAYRPGWPCHCRPAKPCRKHRDAPWFREVGR